MKKKKLVILDGNSLLNRAFYALPPMSTSTGHPTNAIYGFTTMLLKILNDIKPDYIAAAFDRKAPTFRHIEYKDYKAGRKKMPDELAQQIEPAKELLKAFNIGIFEMDGYEADDIIGTIAKRYESNDLEVIIFTGDRDALQLVSDYTKVMITRKGITDIDVYDVKAIKEKYNVTPEGIIDLKGLMGDSSDNIPGVAGVGEKTAVKLLSEFGSLENLYNNLDKVSGKKLKENLETHREDAFFSKKLATIDRNAPIDVDIESIKVENINVNRVRELFLEYEFKSLLDRLKDKNGEDTSGIEFPEIKEADDIELILKNVLKKGVLNFVFISIDKTVEGMIIDGGYFIKREQISCFKGIFESPKIEKNTFGAKQAYLFLNKAGIKLENLDFDAEIASYLLNPSENRYEISSLLRNYAGITINEGEGANINSITAFFVNNLEIIKEKMLKDIEVHGMLELLRKVEMPLIEVLASMEITGFKVDRETLRQIGFDLSEEIDSLTGEIYDLAGEEFNINSPKQLGVILFEKLGLPVIKKTKTGYSTDAEVLDELSDKHAIVEKILSYRQLVKLKSTYIDGLLSSINEDGKIHSSFNQTVTATGRISSTEPNLQNIPIKMEQGRRIRKAFIPENDNYIIVSADYSQIELRVLAHISGDKNLIDAFKQGQDIHRRTASEVFGVPMDEVTTLQRNRAKAVNFGIVYGLSDYGLSKDLKISRKEAKKYIENYFKRYSGVKRYMEDTINTAKIKGYVTTLMNRIRYIPEVKSSNKNVKSLGERLAMNTPIQGTAADIIKIAMVKVYRRIKEERLKSKLILQVHDELVLEVHRDELAYVKKLVREEMEGAVKLSVPLIVDINEGNNWYDAK
ncbi:DNA polymerase I [Fonticella tunisiensis]|uniref:DNA polymerase I n=1 Tax=Fonticella tunisiensis TaxID=1096341 RepID=A0A4V6Q2Z1_9CLOT|nr:DNA polymerase I [Fonticella tunisiensis]TDT61187.1 DNA polymerase I [Fonticella tunisiensis]